jgi:hypothetical protein
LEAIMKISESLESARYMVDPQGNRTDVVIPFETWKKLLEAWERLVERLEDMGRRCGLSFLFDQSLCSDPGKWLDTPLRPTRAGGTAREVLAATLREVGRRRPGQRQA